MNTDAMNRVLLALAQEANDLRWKARHDAGDGGDEAWRQAESLDHAAELIEAELALWALQPADQFGRRGGSPFRETRAKVWYDSVIVDHLTGGVGYGDESPRWGHASIWSGRQRNMFAGRNLGDKARTNMQIAGQFGAGHTVVIQAIGVHLAFTRWAMLDEFIRSASICLYIGDMPDFQIPVRMLLEKRYRDAGDKVASFLPALDRGGDRVARSVTAMIGTGRQTCPPRQSVRVCVETSGAFSAMMEELRKHPSRYPNGYAGITVILASLDSREIL